MQDRVQLRQTRSLFIHSWPLLFTPPFHLHVPVPSTSIVVPPHLCPFPQTTYISHFSTILFKHSIMSFTQSHNPSAIPPNKFALCHETHGKLVPLHSLFVTKPWLNPLKDLSGSCSDPSDSDLSSLVYGIDCYLLLRVCVSGCGLLLMSFMLNSH